VIMRVKTQVIFLLNVSYCAPVLRQRQMFWFYLNISPTLLIVFQALGELLIGVLKLKNERTQRVLGAFPMSCYKFDTKRGLELFRLRLYNKLLLFSKLRKKKDKHRTFSLNNYFRNTFLFISIVFTTRPFRV